MPELPEAAPQVGVLDGRRRRRAHLLRSGPRRPSRNGSGGATRDFAAPTGRLVLCNHVPRPRRERPRRSQVLRRRGRGHLGLRRPDPARDLPPRAVASRRDGLGGGGRVLAAPERGPAPSRPAGRRRVPRGEPGALPHRRGRAPLQALPGGGRPGGDPTLDFATHRDDLLVALLAEALELLGPGRGRADGRAGGRGTTDGRSPSAWSPAKDSARCGPPCTPSPTPSPPTGSPPTPRTGASRPPWWPSTAPSATPPRSTR